MESKYTLTETCHGKYGRVKQAARKTDAGKNSTLSCRSFSGDYLDAQLTRQVHLAPPETALLEIPTAQQYSPLTLYLEHPRRGLNSRASLYGTLLHFGHKNTQAAAGCLNSCVRAWCNQMEPCFMFLATNQYVCIYIYTYEYVYLYTHTEEYIHTHILPRRRRNYTHQLYCNNIMNLLFAAQA